MILRLRYVQQFRDRQGRLRLYLRRRGHPAIPLPPRDDPDFHAAYVAALARAAPPKAARTTPGSMLALATAYLASAPFRQLGPTTRKVYRRIVDRLSEKHGDKPVRLLEPTHVRRLVAELAETPSAANHTLRMLRAMMRYAVEEDWRPDDPTLGVRRLRERAEGTRTWTEDEIAAYEAHWPAGTKQRLALALLIYTGQRRSDIVRMGRQHVRNGAIEVRQVKTGARLLIPLHPELAGLIATERDRLTFLVRDSDGPGYTPNGFYMRFKSWCEAAGLPRDLAPHGLRKAAARRLAEAGCTTHQIGSITGHRTLAEIQRYTNAVNQEALAQEAMAKVVSFNQPKPDPNRRLRRYKKSRRDDTG